MPTIAAAMTAPEPITSVASGMSRPSSSRFCISDAMPTPAPNPIAVDTTPTMSASAATPTITWRREAPIARIRADSRVRWATRIENVLWMLNAATTIAMPAKTSRIVRKKPRKSLSMSFCCSAVSSAPVIASVPSGRPPAMRRLELGGADAVGGAHEHGRDLVRAPGEDLLRRVGVERDVRDAADALGVAERGDADDRDRDPRRGEHLGGVADGEVRVGRPWPGR